MDLRATLTLAALLAGTIASGVLLVRSTSEEEPEREPPRLGVGYYASGAKLYGSGDDGRILYTMSAATVVQEPSDGSIALHDVALDYSPTAEVPWRLTADSGTIPPGAGERMIALSGNVVATTQPSDATPATIRTDYLEFDPATSVARTDRKVVIDYAGSTLHATGLRAMLREDRLQLPSDVVGRYVR